MKSGRRWYFKDYERRVSVTPSGHKRSELVYTGDYYAICFPDAGMRKRYKCIFTALYILGVVSYLFVSLRPTLVARSLWVSVPHMAALIPLIYMGMALFNFLLAGEKWPYRLVKTISMRAGWTSRACAALTGISSLAYAALSAACRSFDIQDARLLLLLLCETAMAAWVMHFQKKYPVRMLPSSAEKKSFGPENRKDTSL